MLSLPSMQLKYEKDVPIANIHTELVCIFCDDLYHPKSEQILSEFNEEELKGLAHLYGVLCEASNLEISSVTELLKNEKWRVVISVAKELSAYYVRHA